jgi:hypothetical protein
VTTNGLVEAIRITSESRAIRSSVMPVKRVSETSVIHARLTRYPLPLLRLLPLKLLFWLVIPVGDLLLSSLLLLSSRLAKPSSWAKQFAPLRTAESKDLRLLLPALIPQPHIRRAKLNPCAPQPTPKTA